MPQTNEEKTEILINLLNQLIKDEEWQKALVVGEYLATLNPEDVFAYRAMGFASLELHDLDKSEEYFLKALECGDADPGTLLQIARIQSYRGDLNGEIFWLEKVIEQDPGNPKAAFLRANALLTLGENEIAKETLEDINETNPDHIPTRVALADLYLLDQDLDKAEEQLREAANIQKNNPQLLHDLGYILKRKKNYEEALGMFFQALELSPNKFEQYSEIGDTFVAMGKPEIAIQYLRKANQLDRTNTLVCYNLSRAYLDLGRYELSIAASKGALQHDPEMENGRANLGLNATLHLGWAYLNSGRLKEAEQCFRKNLQLMAPTYENLGRSLLRQERFEECLQCFERAVELDPENAMYWNLVGNAHSELKQWDEAQKMTEKAIALNPQYCLAYYDLGCIIAKTKGRENEAMKLFKHANSLDKHEFLPCYAISCIYALQNKKKSALNFLRQAIQRGFKDREVLDNDHDLDALRDDDEFQKIIKKMELS